MALFHSPSIVTSGLVMYLDAANIKSYSGAGTSWTDLSGNGNNGVLTNGPTYSAANGGGIVFDGVNDLVACPVIAGSPNVTISAWVYRTSSIVNQGICRKQYVYALSLYNNFIQVAHGTTWVFYNTSVGIELNTWMNIVFTYDGIAIKVFKNVSQISSIPLIGALPLTNVRTNVGYDENGWFWGGTISAVKIYNRALSASEITQNFNTLRHRYNI